MNNFTVEQTQFWWKELLKDTDKFNQWLQKLYRTELSGYTDHMRYLSTSGAIEERTAKILTNIALDELKHSHIIKDLLSDRGCDLGNPEESQYWKIVNAGVTNLNEYCAVNHFGEQIAAFRFEVIEAMEETPSDIKESLRIILPDEQFHKITLEKIAGKESLDKMIVHHNLAVQTLRNSK